MGNRRSTAFQRVNVDVSMKNISRMNTTSISGVRLMPFRRERYSGAPLIRRASLDGRADPVP